MIDEVYATAWKRHQKGDLPPEAFRWYFLGAGVSLIVVWWTTTVLGAILGNVLPEKTVDALGFTMPLIFTSIIVSLLVTRPALFAALSAGVAGVIFAPLPNKLGLLLAAAIGITVGALLEYAQHLPEEVTQ
jgi:predicted branched-subunit amino acid permease